MTAGLALAVALTLPTVIADPSAGPSGWVAVPARGTVPAGSADGFVVDLPSGAVDQEWLERLVALGARGVPVLSRGGRPPAAVRPYLDGAVLAAGADVDDARTALRGLPVVATVADPAAAVAALAAGAAAVLVPASVPLPAAALADLLPEQAPARWSGGALATAMRGGDLATVIGVPEGFPGADVVLEGTWYAAASLAGRENQPLTARTSAGVTVIAVPPLPQGGVVQVARPEVGGAGVDLVRVSGERLPDVGEVLARHQRAVARQRRLAPTWSATQRLLVRVFIGELGRSFEVILEGPAFHEEGVGTDWEIARAWLDGVEWDPDALPELPLLEPSRPRVPPLSLALAPVWDYRLEGAETQRGRRSYRLAFSWQDGDESRRGMAWVDAATFRLVELRTQVSGLTGEVRSSTADTVYAEVGGEDEPVSLPATVTADDLLSAFGGSTTVHRELELSDVAVAPDGFVADRAAAWARPHRMVRDRTGGIVPLVPDGSGGRVVESRRGGRQRFLLAGFLYDPGFDVPIPYGGLQLQDFDFRGRGEQLRLFLAGVVNDAAWSRPGQTVELSLRATTQLLAFTDQLRIRGAEQPGREVNFQRQRLGAAVATSLGRTRWRLDAGIDRLDFSRTDETSPDFRLPPDTWEGTVAIQGDASLGTTTVTAVLESGWRLDWLDGGERSWQRWRLAAVRETTPFPFGRLSVGAELWGGRRLDRFSAPSPGRFGGVSMRGIASNTVRPERLALVHGTLAMPLSPRIRGEIGADLAWVREERSGYHARPLAGVGVGVSLPGPFRTLARVAVGVPVTTPASSSPTLEVLLLRSF